MCVCYVSFLFTCWQTWVENYTFMDFPVHGEHNDLIASPNSTDCCTRDVMINMVTVPNDSFAVPVYLLVYNNKIW